MQTRRTRDARRRAGSRRRRRCCRPRRGSSKTKKNPTAAISSTNSARSRCRIMLSSPRLRRELPRTDSLRHGYATIYHASTPMAEGQPEQDDQPQHDAVNRERDEPVPPDPVHEPGDDRPGDEEPDDEPDRQHDPAVRRHDDVPCASGRRACGAGVAEEDLSQLQQRRAEHRRDRQEERELQRRRPRQPDRLRRRRSSPSSGSSPGTPPATICTAPITIACQNFICAIDSVVVGMWAALDQPTSPRRRRSARSR